LGVIDSLSAGYRHLGWRLYLLLIPVLLDLFLWLAPRLSIAPLYAQVAEYYTALARWQNGSPDLQALFAEMAQAMGAAGQQSNLLDLLISSSLLQVPSLLLIVRPLTDSSIRQIASLGSVAGLSGFFGLAGLLVGVLYLQWLAQTLPIGSGTKGGAWSQVARSVLRQWLLLVLFVIFVFGGLLLVVAMGSVVLTLIALVSPGVGSFLTFLFGGMLLVVGVYLYFVPAGLIMDDLTLFTAIGQSFRLVRDNFGATVGLILLTRLISVGITVILQRLFAYQEIGILAAILINAYIGNGLALGLLVFYRSRLLMAQGQTVSYEL
jgi:hypothetical protein